MQLPGAIGGSAGGEAASHATGPRDSSEPAAGSGGGPPYVPPKPVAIPAPDEATITGHPLSGEGSKGEMTFDKAGGDLALLKLSLAGEKITKPGQACKVDVPLPAPLRLIPAGRPSGTIRYGVPLPACPFAIDVLSGAVLVTRDGQASCDFAASECRVSPDGLWGPRASDITPKRAKELERERVRFETTMRANFHALLRKAGKDREAVKAIARDQAAFSSEREMTCRDYADETVHGFCSTQITQARALALFTQFGPMESAHERRRALRAKGKSAVPVAKSESEPASAPRQP